MDVQTSNGERGPEAEQPKIRILVVDDETNVRDMLGRLLGGAGYMVTLAGSAEQALEELARRSYDITLADIRMPGLDGLALVKEIQRRSLATVVILMSAYGSAETAIEAIKQGAYDYIPKPFHHDEVILTLRKVEERERLRRENRQLRSALGRGAEERRVMIYAPGSPLQRLLEMVKRVADHDVTVLIQGESGTGKELIARALHQESRRRVGPFVAVNCGAIPENLLESELFGYKKGAFTDAHRDKKGLFEEASDGTLLLDEIGELPQPLQVKLLRVLQDGEIRPIGDTVNRRVNARVVSATGRDLRSSVETGGFRQDLFFRLNVVSLRVPALRERREDIPLLVDHFIGRCNARYGYRVERCSPEVMEIFLSYRWPGNIRELEHAIEHAFVLAEGSVIGVFCLPESLQRVSEKYHEPESLPLPLGELSFKKVIPAVEQTLIVRALDRTDGNRTAAAKILEISVRTLSYKIVQYGLGKIG
ncbi:sigma-54-dependent Fis family transcriptional regulator [Candidatus Uhrbacteria bacterium]|nr:sigma-54-dependent Fis family transcriptional regulator [Candidatus Uhrbacteria bacterium]